MTQPRTPANWINVKDRLPDLETYGPYPRVIVAIGYHAHPEFGFGQQIAELRFINGDKTRPSWVSTDKNLSPIENSAYGVMFWTDMLADPVREG